MQPDETWQESLDMRHMKRMAWERLMVMLRDEKLSAADLLRVIAADVPQQPMRGDLVLIVRSDGNDA